METESEVEFKYFVYVRVGQHERLYTQYRKDGVERDFASVDEAREVALNIQNGGSFSKVCQKFGKIEKVSYGVSFFEKSLADKETLE